MAQPPPALVMVAGPNGSGKTTLIRTLRAAREIALPEYYINADDLKRERGLDDRGAQKLAEVLRLESIAQRRSFLYETVMSHPSKIAELQAAALAGYASTVIFVATADPGVNVERVALRVADGGHAVPRDRIRARHHRSIALAPSAIAFGTYAYVYDNTAWGADAAQQLQAALAGTVLQPAAARPAAWVAGLIEKVNARAAELEEFYEAANERMGLAVPNLYAGVCEGPITESGKYYAIQADRISGKPLIHDKALLTRPVLDRRSYRIEYAEGVSKVARRTSGRISAVKQVTQ